MRLLRPAPFLAVAAPLFAPAQTVPKAERCLLYAVERIAPDQAPKIDGKLAESVWKDRERIDTLRNFLGSNVGDFASQRSEFTVLCDGMNLFIGATFHEEEMEKLKASPANDPFWNDCIEVYFDPRHDGTRSIQLVIDCIGQRMWEKRYDEGYGWWVDNAWHMLADWEGRSARGPQAWTVEIRLNCASLGIDNRPGSVCGFNPCRFRLGAGDEFSAWAFGGRRRQKSIPDWGHLLFAGVGESVRGREVTRADIERVYGRLGGRRIEVPVPAGFRALTAEGEQRITFAEQLAPHLARCEELVAAARRHSDDGAARLGEEHEFVRGLDGAVKQMEALFGEARAATLTMGAYDRLVDALQRATDRLDDATWQTRVAVLVADVQHGGGKP